MSILGSHRPLIRVIDSARGHLDTAQCHLSDAIEYLDAARRTRAEEILDRTTAALADLDRLRATLPTSETCGQCWGTHKVVVSTGKWNYTAPCPVCRPAEFRAAEIDGDHVVIGPDWESK
ncbi:hypothetical protein H7J51_05360 [Mycobacterium crocinum]|uniref:Uncharacterized protein n=1 Tax=Mycolicibacterium crocinum TaxID=388459 RepID=A0ABY3TMQ2_9MYCO|nr:hypothetical protein [Mycolicibacterium crocinum]MCV7214712.1 hypothetical protein [Mycolicibacterium crocinum]ULN41601.1 hypothetical protein MI149_00080 [Mycolicibacterium crocinum]